MTVDEFRGTGGHALDSLLRMTGLVSPVQPDELAMLSQAYLGARYPPFPPRGAPTVPLAMYGAVDAENALEVAKIRDMELALADSRKALDAQTEDAVGLAAEMAEMHQQVMPLQLSIKQL